MAEHSAEVVAAARRELEAGGVETAVSVARAVEHALESRYGVSLAGMPPRERRARLERGGADPAVVTSAEAARSALEGVRFGGVGIERAVAEIARLEHALAADPATARLSAAAGMGGLVLLLSIPIAMNAMGAARAIAASAAFAQVTAANRGSPGEVWSQANSDYRAGDMDGALRGYETLAERHDDPRLDADRAAALWRLGRRGEALARYREALALAPRNGVIRADAERLWVELDRPARGGALPRALGFVRLDELLAALVVASWLGAGAVVTARSRGRVPERRMGQISAAVIIGIALLAALHAWTIERPVHAVATAGAELSATPGGEVIAALPEGALVQVLEREEDGWRVRAAGLPAGWVAPGLIVPLD